MPIAQTSVPVQFDDIFKTFDPQTRRGDPAGPGRVRRHARPARGSALNDTIHSLPELLCTCSRWPQYLADPNTELTRFFDSLNAFMGAVAPVAQVNARLFTDVATTFEAISRDPKALESTIAESPSTLDVSTNSLRPSSRSSPT